MESHGRSIVKWVTGRIGLAASVGALDTLVKLGAFYPHERVRLRVDFGKSKPPDYGI